MGGACECITLLQATCQHILTKLHIICANLFKIAHMSCLVFNKFSLFLYSIVTNSVAICYCAFLAFHTAGVVKLR